MAAVFVPAAKSQSNYTEHQLPRPHPSVDPAFADYVGRVLRRSGRPEVHGREM